MLSRLDWDLSFFPTFDFNLQGKIFKIAFIEFDGRIGIPNNFGNIQDYDWLNSVTSEWINDDPCELTNYSYHKTDLTDFYKLNLKIGGNLIIKDIITISPFICYDYSFVSLDGKNGYQQYKSDNWEKKYFSQNDYAKMHNGKVISYKQEINTFLLGLKLSTNIIPHFSIDTSFMISPNLSFIKAEDYHYFNNGYYGTLFFDDIKNANKFDWEMNISYVYKNYKIGLNTSVEYIPLSKGPDYTKTLNSKEQIISKEWEKTTSEGGTQRLIWNISLMFQLSF